jgi:phage tail-like protein
MASPSVYNNFQSTLVTDPVRNFKFVVTFEPIDGWSDSGLGQMGFVSVSGLSAAIESIAYREGGYNTNVHQIPGQTSFTPITFSKGVLLGQKSNQGWLRRIFALISQQTGAVGVGAGFRCNTRIRVLSHPNPGGYNVQAGAPSTTGPGGQHVSMEFVVYNCWITNISYGNLDAGANALMVEEMTMVHEGFDVAIATDYTASASV